MTNDDFALLLDTFPELRRMLAELVTNMQSILQDFDLDELQDNDLRSDGEAESTTAR